MTNEQFQYASLVLHGITILLLAWALWRSRYNRRRLKHLDHWNDIALARSSEALNFSREHSRQIQSLCDRVGVQSPKQEPVFVWLPLLDDRVRKIENRAKRGKAGRK